MSNGFNEKCKIENKSKTVIKKRSLSKVVTALTLLLSTLTATANPLICPRASEFYPNDPGVNYFTQWMAANPTHFRRSIATFPAAYTSSYFLPTNTLAVIVTHNKPPFGQHRDTLECNYSNGMVVVRYDTNDSPNFILSDNGYDQVNRWSTSTGIFSSTHVCNTNAGSPEICSVDVQ